jgi:hypothetical protein
MDIQTFHRYLLLAYGHQFIDLKQVGILEDLPIFALANGSKIRISDETLSSGSSSTPAKPVTRGYLEINRRPGVSMLQSAGMLGNDPILKLAAGIAHVVQDSCPSSSMHDRQETSIKAISAPAFEVPVLSTKRLLAKDELRDNATALQACHGQLPTASQTPIGAGRSVKIAATWPPLKPLISSVRHGCSSSAVDTPPKSQGALANHQVRC